MNRKRWGLALMAIWFVLWGLLTVTNFEFEFSNVILGILAVAAGGLVLWGINEPA